MAVLAVRRDLLRRLWPEERRIRGLVVEALAELKDSNTADHRNKYTEDFLASVFSMIRRPMDVIEICAACPRQELAHEFLDRFVFSSAADGDVIASLVSDSDVFRKLPPHGSWVGHALVRRFQILSQDHPGRRFEIEELLPLGVETDRVVARAILGSAFDESELSESAIRCLPGLFPGDRHFAPETASDSESNE